MEQGRPSYSGAAPWHQALTGRPGCSPAGQRLLALRAGASAVQGPAGDHAAKNTPANSHLFLRLERKGTRFHSALSAACPSGTLLAKPQPAVQLVWFSSSFSRGELSASCSAARVMGSCQQPKWSAASPRSQAHRRSRRPSALPPPPAARNPPQPLCLRAAALPCPVASPLLREQAGELHLELKLLPCKSQFFSAFLGQGALRTALSLEFQSLTPASQTQGPQLCFVPPAKTVKPPAEVPRML